MIWLDIFDVEHGQCSLITTDIGGHILIDCGHNSTTAWRPSTHLRASGVGYLDELVITNFDEDHVSDLANVRTHISIGSLTKNPTVYPDELRQLKSNHGVGRGIDSLCNMMSQYTGTAQPIETKVSMWDDGFWNVYPSDFTDENNLSYIHVANLGVLTFCFTGDMTRLGWLKLLGQPRFVSILPRIDVFMAPHHGRADGCCQELYDSGLSPLITIISDSGVQHATQETVQWYAARTSGIQLGGATRRVLTTRSDGNMTFEVTPAQWALETYK